MRFALYEDRAVTGFHPLTLTRPAFELICGHHCLRERLVRHWEVAAWGVFIRDYLADCYRERFPEAHINHVDWLVDDDTLLINGRWLPDVAALDGIRLEEAGYVGDTPVYLTLTPKEAHLLYRPDLEATIGELAATRRKAHAGGVLLERPWDLVEQNGRQITADFTLRGMGGRLPESSPQLAIQGSSRWIDISRDARIEPFVVLDARRGPVSVEAGATILPFTRLEGPCHIGHDAQLFRAHIRSGTTIGPVCRIGGEIEASIFQGYANKYHDGFLGHSYVGAWVNLGAETTNSDLKSDYSRIKVPLTGTPLETGLTKVGCFIGDHTKTAIGSLFNTGASIGVMCLLLPGGELLPKHIPSFTSIWHGGLAPGLELDHSLLAARVAMRRRDHEMSDAEEKVLRLLFQMTRREREDALFRAQMRNDLVPLLPAS